jgi:hypothetical protein
LLGNTEATTVAPFNSATNTPILSSRSSILIRSSGFPARAPLLKPRHFVLRLCRFSAQSPLSLGVMQDAASPKS